MRQARLSHEASGGLSLTPPVEKGEFVMKFVRTVLPLAAAFGLLACGAPSPEKVCDHALSLVKKEAGDEMSDDDVKELAKLCVEQTKQEQEKDGDAYAKKAKCVMAASNMEAAMKCDEKKPAADAEPAEE
jgi:hypothetical protein